MTEGPADWRVDRGGHALMGDDTGGDAAPVLLLHGLTATRRYVVHGSRAIERAGHRVLSYDARGHGASDPAPDRSAYTYRQLADDAVAVMDHLGIERAILVGHSMGGHTAARLAILHPDRVEALVLGAPAHLGRGTDTPDDWDRLAAGLEQGGPEGFYEAIRSNAPPKWRETLRTMVLQRMARHEHPHAVADALRSTTRSAAFDGMAALEEITCPTLILGTRDELDPGHPLAVAEDYHERIAGSRLVVEPEGETPITWRGGTLSKVVLDFLGSPNP